MFPPNLVNGGGRLEFRQQRHKQTGRPLTAKLKHIAIVAMNPEEMARFYVKVIEMEIIDRSPTGSGFLSDGYVNRALLPNRVEDGEAIAERLKKFKGLGPTMATPKSIIGKAEEMSKR